MPANHPLNHLSVVQGKLSHLSYFPFGGPKLNGGAIPDLANTISTHCTRRPHLRLTNLQWCSPSKAPVLARANSSLAMAQQKEDGKWRATVSEAIPASIEKVWGVLSDFDGLQRNFPKFFLSCETVEGEKNQVGSLRVVKAGMRISGNVIEARERLLTNDEVSHTVSYATEHIGLGWTGYKAFITAKSVESGHTIVNWSFELDPLSTMTHAQYIQLQTDFIQEVLQIVSNIVS